MFGVIPEIGVRQMPAVVGLCEHFPPGFRPAVWLAAPETLAALRAEGVVFPVPVEAMRPALFRDRASALLRAGRNVGVLHRHRSGVYVGTEAGGTGCRFLGVETPGYEHGGGGA